MARAKRLKQKAQKPVEKVLQKAAKPFRHLVGDWLKQVEPEKTDATKGKKPLIAPVEFGKDKKKFLWIDQDGEVWVKGSPNKKGWEVVSLSEGLKVHYQKLYGVSKPLAKKTKEAAKPGAKASAASAAAKDKPHTKEAAKSLAAALDETPCATNTEAAGQTAGAAITGSPDPECNPDCDFDLPFFSTPMKVGEIRKLPGKNPNGLQVEKVKHRTQRAGVYLKIHVEKKKIKIGSASNFADRYTDTAPAGNTKYQGGCRIRYEIVIEPLKGYAEPGPDCPKTWNAKRQRQYDEEYIQRLVPNTVKYQAEEEAQNAVDYDCWVKCRHVFGYATVEEDFGQFLTATTGGGRACKASR